MSELHIVLHQPQIPQNTGNIARTCGATGATLHLIHPLGFQVTDAKLKRAGLDYWHLLSIYHYEDLEAFFAKNQGTNYYFTTKASQKYTEVRYQKPAYLFFGREDAGLPKTLLEQDPSHCVRIPMKTEARSLNLSNSVAIAGYEVLRQWGFSQF